MSILYPPHIASRKASLGDIKLPYSKKHSSSIGLLNEALRLDRYLPTPYLNSQDYTQASFESSDIIAPDGSKVDFDKVQNILEKLGKLLDQEDTEKNLTYFEYYSILAQLVVGGYKMYMGKPENPKDVQVFKKNMNQFLRAFVDGCAEELLQKKT